jgi:hypothetical protein
MITISQTVLNNLIKNEKYARRVLPYIKVEYFDHTEEKKLFELVNNYFFKYNQTPTFESLFIEAKNLEKIDETVFNKLDQLIRVSQAIN